MTVESDALLDEGFYWWLGSWLVFGMWIGLLVIGMVAMNAAVTWMALIPCFIGWGMRGWSKILLQRAVEKEKGNG